MKPQTQIAIGSILALIGTVGIILGLLFNLTELVRPWSFIAGFVTGLCAGLGAVLTIAGLISRGKE